MSILKNKHILLVITGSIAAYKSPDIIRRLQSAGAIVETILSHSASQLITALALNSVAKKKVKENLWHEEAQKAMTHIHLAKWADLILIAPASANALANLANGHANDLMSNVVLASQATIVVAPAMNQAMWRNQAVQTNIQRLQKRHVVVIEPDSGEQACGDVGVGRLIAIDTLLEIVGQQFASKALDGKKICISAGATIEDIDPVRYLSNRSSGKMAVALANACLSMGGQVDFVYGHISVDLPQGVRAIACRSAEDMYQKVHQSVKDCQLFIAAAAVSDYKIKKYQPQKLKKDNNEMTLTFIKNKDIVSSVAQLSNRPFCLGFAAESENLLSHARLKFEQKKLDMMIANQIGKKGVGFEADENEVYVISGTGEQKLNQASKTKIAEKIIAIVAKKIKAQQDK